MGLIKTLVKCCKRPKSIGAPRSSAGSPQVVASPVPPSTPQVAPNHPKKLIYQVFMARLQRRREFRAKIGRVECPKTGLPALNSAQMAQGEAAGKIPSCSRESWGEKVQELAPQPAAPWLLREVLAKPEHSGDIWGCPHCGHPPQAPRGAQPPGLLAGVWWSREGSRGWGRAPASPSPAAQAQGSGFMLMLAGMLMGSLIITARSCNWAGFGELRRHARSSLMKDNLGKSGPAHCL